MAGEEPVEGRGRAREGPRERRGRAWGRGRGRAGGEPGEGRGRAGGGPGRARRLEVGRAGGLVCKWGRRVAWKFAEFLLTFVELMPWPEIS